MESLRIQQCSPTWTLISVLLATLLILYSLSRRSPVNVEENQKQITVSLCQIRVHSPIADVFDDRAILNLLVQMKINDFSIGSPVLGPDESLIYLCEHRLKSGLSQLKLERELLKVIKSYHQALEYISWTCV